MSLEHLKSYIEKEIEKFGQKTSTSLSDQELIEKLLCNYKNVIIAQEMERELYSGHRSGHSMRDREIAALEEKIDKSQSDYEKEFYKKVIRVAQDYRE